MDTRIASAVNRKLTIAEIDRAVRLGAPLEAIIPAGADVEYWRRLLRNYQANQGKPKRKRSRSRTRQSGKPARRVNHANQVIGKATSELLDRVNGQASVEAEDEPIPWQGEPQPQPEETEQEQINEQAKYYGATHVSKFGPTFYRKSGHCIQICRFIRGEGFTHWTRDSRSYMPEWVGVIR